MPLPQVTGVWRAGTDPELRFTASGVQICSFRAVASSAKKEEDGSWTTTGEIWARITVWGDYAEYVVNSISKGQRFTMIGRIEVKSYETREGEKREGIEITADAIAPFRERDEKPKPRQSSEVRNPEDRDPWGAAPTNQSDEPPF